MHARLILFLPALAALALAACGGPVLFVEVEVPRACVAQGRVAFPGVATSGTATGDLDVPLVAQIPLLTTSGADTVLVLDDVTIAPVSGSPDLSGIDGAVVDVVPASGAPVAAVRYTRDPAAPPPSQLVLSGGGVDVAPLLQNGSAHLRIVASGRPPPTAWAADVQTCVHGKSKVPYP
jgi:hypothetical protein